MLPSPAELPTIRELWGKMHPEAAPLPTAPLPDAPPQGERCQSCTEELRRQVWESCIEAATLGGFRRCCWERPDGNASCPTFPKGTALCCSQVHPGCPSGGHQEGGKIRIQGPRLDRLTVNLMLCGTQLFQQQRLKGQRTLDAFSQGAGTAPVPSLSTSPCLVSAQGEAVPLEVTSEGVPFLAGPLLSQLTLAETYSVFLSVSERERCSRSAYPGHCRHL